MRYIRNVCSLAPLLPVLLIGVHQGIFKAREEVSLNGFLHRHFAPSTVEHFQAEYLITYAKSTVTSYVPPVPERVRAGLTNSRLRILYCLLRRARTQPRSKFSESTRIDP